MRAIQENLKMSKNRRKIRNNGGVIYFLVSLSRLSGLKMSCCVVDRTEVDPVAASVGVSGLISSITSFLESDYVWPRN